MFHEKNGDRYGIGWIARLNWCMKDDQEVVKMLKDISNLPAEDSGWITKGEKFRLIIF